MNNSAALYNGAIGNHGFLTIINSTIAGNTAYDSQFGTTGGIGSDFDLLIVNSTISGNRAPNAASGAAGGIFSLGLLYLVNSTVTNNEARTFGGVNSAGSNQTFVRNSLIAGNRGLNNEVVPDIGSTVNPNRIVSLGNNLVGNRGTTAYFTQLTDRTGGAGNAILDAMLAPLGNYGGATPTHALLNNSLAKDAGNDCVTTNNCENGSNLGFNLITDQRGSLAPRKAGAAVDIGAFELNVSFSTSATGNGGQGTLPEARALENYSVVFTASRLNNISGFENGNKLSANSGVFFYSIVSGSLPFGLSFNQSTGELSGTVQQGGSYAFTILAIDADGIAGAQSYNLTVFSPTAASVSIGGRVLTPEGSGLRNALVTIRGADGETKTTLTSAFGYYRFAGVQAGQTFVLRVVSKRYQFAAQTINVGGETNDLNFVAQN